MSITWMEADSVIPHESLRYIHEKLTTMKDQRLPGFGLLKNARKSHAAQPDWTVPFKLFVVGLFQERPAYEPKSRPYAGLAAEQSVGAAATHPLSEYAASHSLVG